MKTYLLLFLAFIIPLFSAAQTDEIWQRNNDRGNRFEGTRTQKVNSTLTLVGLHGNFEPYTFEEGQQLKVRFFSDKSTTIAVRAEELKRDAYYLMEAKPFEVEAGFSEFGPWEVDEVLSKEKIPADNLSISVRQPESEKRHFLPAFIYHTAMPDSSNSYTAYFQAGKTIYNYKYQLYRGLETKSDQRLLSIFKQRKVFKNQPFSIRLDFSEINLQDSAEGWYTFAIELQTKPGVQKVKDQYEFHFYHRPILKP